MEELVANALSDITTDADAMQAFLNLKSEERIKLREVLEGIAARIKEFARKLTEVESRILIKDADALRKFAKELSMKLSVTENQSNSQNTIAKYSKGKYNKHTTYNEFNTLAMSWRNNAQRSIGELTIIHKNLDVAVLIEATENGYIEVAHGAYQKVRSLYEQLYTDAVEEIYGNLESIRVNQGRDIWDLQYDENRKYDDGSVNTLRKTGVQGNNSRSNEHSGNGSEKSLNKNTKKTCFTDEDYLAAVERGDMEAAQALVDEAAERNFRNSKARDSDGKLVKVYHGTESEDFYEFDKARQGQTDSSLWGRGYYFSSDPEFAEMFGDNVGLDNVTEAYRGTKSANDSSRRENHFLLISEFTDSNGNDINVPVYIEETSMVNNVYIDTNKISTVFGRDNFREYIKTSSCSKSCENKK